MANLHCSKHFSRVLGGEYTSYVYKRHYILYSLASAVATYKSKGLQRHSYFYFVPRHPSILNSYETAKFLGSNKNTKLRR